MKNAPLNLLLTAVLMLTLSVSHSLPNMATAHFHYNPLLLNGKSMDMTRLSIVSKGKLQVVLKDDDKTKEVPFKIYLVRDGKIVGANSQSCNHVVREIELSSILKSARAGDHLYVDPAGSGREIGRRIIRVKADPLLPRIQWFYGLNKGKDGC
jgi:hypothetical protein